MLDVRKFVAVVFHRDVRGTNAGHPRPADLAGAQRVQQNRKPCEVLRVFWFDASQRHLVLKLTQVFAGRDDGRADAHDMEPRPIRAAIISDLDDVGLADLIQGIRELVVLLAFLLADRVEKRVPHFRRDVERLAGLRLFKAVGHRYVPMPRPAKLPYS
ncbi:MAG: hypothetical protein KDB14_23390 [Planctomycetales bacterium]|nr:hypothetical protein [Planctomycetales bacterium]